LKYAKNDSVRGLCFIFLLNDGKFVLFKLRNIASSNRLYGVEIVVEKNSRIEITDNYSSIRFSEICKCLVILPEQWEQIYSEFKSFQSDLDSIAMSMKGYTGRQDERRYFYSRYQAILITIKPNGIDYNISHGTSKAKSFLAYYVQENEEYFIAPHNTYGNWSYNPGVMYKVADWFEISPDNYTKLSQTIKKMQRRIYGKISSLYYWSTIKS